MTSYFDERILTLTDKGFKWLPMDEQIRADVKKFEEAKAAWKANAKERRRQARLGYARFLKLKQELSSKPTNTI